MTLEKRPAWHRVPLEIVAEIGGADLKINQLLKIGRGAVVELGRKIDSPIALKIGARVLAHGEIESENGSLRVRVTKIYKK